MSYKSSFEFWDERVNKLKNRVIDITINPILKYFYKLVNCHLKKNHKWVEMGYVEKSLWGEFKLFKCKVCGKVDVVKGPFPPEHVNCRCTIKEGD